jgi:hypothetical protein
MRGRPLKPLATDEAKRDRLIQIYQEQAELHLLHQWAEDNGLTTMIMNDAYRRAEARIASSPPAPESGPVLGHEPAEDAGAVLAAPVLPDQTLQTLSPRERAEVEARNRRLASNTRIA